MLKSNTRIRSGGPPSLHLLVCLAVLLSLGAPMTALAAPPEPNYQGPEKCAECHAAETDAWKDSPHAQAMAHIDETMQSACESDVADQECTCLTCHTTDFDPATYSYTYGGVSCEACHGPYVEGHPQNGVMQLDVDSSTCADCHTDTYQQWQQSPHAAAGVQCIGCHLSHSQDFRLTDEALCGSCHKNQVEDFAHTAHESADVSCTDCHLSSTHAAAASDGTAAPDTMTLVSTGQSIGRPEAPSHLFSVVSSEACVNCHGQTIHELMAGDTSTQAASTELLAMAGQVPELTAQLETQEKTNKSLQVMTLVSLGLGMGIGGMLGIVFMLVVGYITQGRAKR
jgi:hypothetical protein